MTKEDFKNVTYFDYSENWGEIEKIDKRLIYELDKFRAFIKKPILINCGTQGVHIKNSYHYKGLAVDIHILDSNVFTDFINALRFGFKGIGIYPQWHNPGLHLDIREAEHRAIWMQLDNVYLAVTKKIMRYL